MNPPFTYAAINAVEGSIHPSFLRIHNTSMARFFKRYLLQDAISVFKFVLPQNWDADYFRYSLIGFGFVTVFNTDKFGVIPQQCGLSGFNVFYRPTICTIANPLIGGDNLVIGKNCEIIKMQPDYSGVAAIVDYYGDLMALTWEAITTNILNSKLSYVCYAGSKQEAETFKKAYDAVASGDPLVVMRGSRGDDSPFGLFTQNLAQNYIAPEMLESLRNIQSAFRAEIGIPDLSVHKKERLITDEARKTDIYSRSKAKMWLDEMKNGMKKVKAMFPSIHNLDVEFAMKEGENIATNVIGSRPVSV